VKTLIIPVIISIQLIVSMCFAHPCEDSCRGLNLQDVLGIISRDKLPIVLDPFILRHKGLFRDMSLGANSESKGNYEITRTLYDLMKKTYVNVDRLASFYKNGLKEFENTPAYLQWIAQKKECDDLEDKGLHANSQEVVQLITAYKAAYDKDPSDDSNASRYACVKRGIDIALEIPLIGKGDYNRTAAENKLLEETERDDSLLFEWREHIEYSKEVIKKDFRLNEKVRPLEYLKSEITSWQNCAASAIGKLVVNEPSEQTTNRESVQSVSTR